MPRGSVCQHVRPSFPEAAAAENLAPTPPSTPGPVLPAFMPPPWARKPTAATVAAALADAGPAVTTASGSSGEVPLAPAAPGPVDDDVVVVVGEQPCHTSHWVIVESDLQRTQWVERSPSPITPESSDSPEVKRARHDV